MSEKKKILSPLFLLVFTACGGDTEGRPASETFVASTHTDAGDSETTDTTGTTSGAETTDEGGTEETGDPGVPDLPDDEQCLGVDILWVVDSAYDHAAMQDNLPSTAHPLVFMLEEELGLAQVGVTDTTPAYFPNCVTQCGNGGSCAFDKLGGGTLDLCQPAQVPSSECREGFGALNDFSVGANAANVDCDTATHYWKSGVDGPLEDYLSCALRVGTTGGGSNILTAPNAALAPNMTGAGGCNAGLLRQEAQLVVIFATTRDIPPEWAPFMNTLLNWKGGNPVLVIGLLNDEGCQNNTPQPNLRAAIEFAPYHAVLSNCSALATFSGRVQTEVLPLADLACENHQLADG